MLRLIFVMKYKCCNHSGLTKKGRAGGERKKRRTIKGKIVFNNFLQGRKNCDLGKGFAFIRLLFFSTTGIKHTDTDEELEMGDSDPQPSPHPSTHLSRMYIIDKLTIYLFKKFI